MTKITYNGSTYFIPATGDQSWGDSLSAYLVALATGSLNRSGGIFQITNDVNFGSTNGLVALYFTARNGLSSSNPASAGSDLIAPNRFRLGVIPNATPSSAIYDAVAWRNNTNSADLRLLPHAGTETILNYNGVDLVDVSSVQTLTNKIISGSTIAGYLKQDGSTQLTSSWNAGAFSGTFNSVAVGSAANTISALTSFVANADRISITANTGNDTLFQVNSLLNREAVSYTILNASSTSGAAYFSALQSSGNKWSMGFDLVTTGSTWALANTDGFATANKIFLQATTAGLITIGAASGTQTHVVNGNLTTTGNNSSNSFLAGYTSTATAASTTTLTVSSPQQQYFTGSTTQTVLLPVVSTLALGQSFIIVNNSSGVVTVQSSGSNTIQAMAAGSQLVVTVILTTGTSAASWNSNYAAETPANAITALTGDATATGPGSAALTLATVNSNVGSFGSSTAIPNFTVNGKGLITAAGTSVVIAPAGTLTGTTLNSTVVSSSLTSVGTLVNLTVTNTIVGSITGNAATVTTNANLTGPVTSIGNVTTIGAGQVLDTNLAVSYLKADGTRALTGNWAAGAFSGTFNSVIVGSAANTISGLSTIVNTGIITLPTATDTLVARTTTDTLTNKTLTSPTINGGTHTAITSLGIRDTSAAFDVTLAATSSSTLTASRTLTIDTNNVSSTLKMGANLTVSGASTINGTFSGSSSGTNTGDQTITLTGNVTGSGTGSFATTIAAGVVTNTMLAGSISDTNLATSYIKADGTRALTGNWSAGAFSAILNSVAVGSSANTISGLTAFVANVDRISVTGNTGSDTLFQVNSLLNKQAVAYTILNASSSSGAAYFAAIQSSGIKWSMGFDLGVSSSAWNLAATDGFGTSSSIYVQVSTAGVVTLGASAGTQTHNINGNVHLTNTQNALSSIQLDNLSANTSTSAQAAFLAKTGDGTTSNRYAYFQSQNNDSANTNWFTGTLGTNHWVVAKNSSATASTATTYIDVAPAGLITLGQSGATQQHALNTLTGTTGAGIGTLTNLPTGKSGNPTGYVQITINGSTAYIPYW